MMRDSQLMQQAMAESGCLAQKEISGDLITFNAIGLTGAERLSVVAGVVASVTAKRHTGEQARFLQQLHELTRPATGGSSMDSGMALEPRAEQIAAGIRLLDAAFDRLVERLAAAGLKAERAAAIESVLLARLLAAHRPHRIRLALLAAAFALAQPDYKPGDVVPFLPVETPAVTAPAAVTPVAAAQASATPSEEIRTGTHG
jgi:hypothetical protein